MSLPKPRSEELEDEFIERTMSDPVMIKELPDEKERYAVALVLWEKICSRKSFMGVKHGDL
jgi:hypothetical protein